MKFYKCEKCGKILEQIQTSKCEMVECCHQPMTIMTANTSDGAKEKHVPVVEQNGNLVTVTVGSIEHPMMEEHYIQWIVLETEGGNQKKYLKPGEKPQAVFAVTEGERVLAAYEYCNLHGLWMKNYEQPDFE